jgi:hypothetical protein
VYYDDERDAEECIRRLDGREWGRLGRRLRVEFAKNDANVRAREAKRRSGADPNNTLFVAGFDPRGTRAEELEKVFEEFGRLKVSMKCNARAVVRFEIDAGLFCGVCRTACFLLLAVVCRMVTELIWRAFRILLSTK